MWEFARDKQLKFELLVVVKIRYVQEARKM